MGGEASPPISATLASGPAGYRGSVYPFRIASTTTPPLMVGRSSRPLCSSVSLLVVQAEAVQDGGVQVVDVGAVLDGVQADLVGGAVD